MPPARTNVHLPNEMYLCAWCEKTLDLPPGNLRGQPTVKHGMCWECLLEQLADVAGRAIGRRPPAGAAQGAH